MKAVWDLKSQFDKYRDAEVFDCMIAEFLLSHGKFVHTQDDVLKKYKVTTLDELAKKQQEKLAKLPKLHSLFTDIEMKLVPVLWHMEQEGILLDVTCLKSVGEELRSAIVSIEDEIKKEVGFDINLNSAIQVGNFLAEKVGVPLAKTKTGRYATNENELAQYKLDFPIIEKLLSYRELTKLQSTYVESLITKADSNSRIHTTYHQVAVNTGRLASTNPNNALSYLLYFLHFSPLLSHFYPYLYRYCERVHTTHDLSYFFYKFLSLFRRIINLKNKIIMNLQQHVN